MLSIYARLMNAWENRLATRDTNRVVRPFEWGLEWLDLKGRNGDCRRAMAEYGAQAVASSERFFGYEPPSDYRLEGDHLTFTSPVKSPFPENNTVYGTLFPCHRSGNRAVLVLPQWNADAQGHVGLCKLLNRFGLTALRMSMAYHDRRMPPELQRADFHVSSNIGRTIHACRQSVIDARACLGWLESQGYKRLAILGTSLGSCIAFITAAHDLRPQVAVYNHASMYFSDVVWTGLATQHVHKGLSEGIGQDELRSCWAVISPASYLDRMNGRKMKSLLIWARHDTTFLPCYSKQIIESFRERGFDHQVMCLPCGHYTTGRFPFNMMDGFAMCRFLARNL